MSDEYEGSDGDLDEFEESVDEANLKRHADKLANKPYDEAYEVSQDLSTAESFDGRDARYNRDNKLKNDKYDEAVEVSQSIEQSGLIQPKGRMGALATKSDLTTNKFSNSPSKAQFQNPSILGEQPKSTNIANRPFDEAVEFSQEEESTDSFDTRGSDRKGNKPKKGNAGGVLEAMKGKSPAGTESRPLGQGIGKAPMGAPPSVQQKPNMSLQPTGKAGTQPQVITSKQSEQDDDDEDEGSSSESGGEQESYDNLEGAYNPKDYSHLNVPKEVHELFQYIERYKPHEVELETTLKCFIPEYIPAIGEMDAFVKVPRPDGKLDNLGLKVLDEPASEQSDATVLELKLRATSKKQRYGEVAVRSIEDAAKNPEAIDKWIQNISELHRSKPEPQVHYKRNMPDLEKLLEVWPPEFEAVLDKLSLPSPDLDLTIAEYARLLCSILDIPTYDNPIESLHQLFSLYIAFRDNPHFQARHGKDNNGEKEYGDADVMQITQGYK